MCSIASSCNNQSSSLPPSLQNKWATGLSQYLISGTPHHTNPLILVGLMTPKWEVQKGGNVKDLLVIFCGGIACYSCLLSSNSVLGQDLIVLSTYCGTIGPAKICGLTERRKKTRDVSAPVSEISNLAGFLNGSTKWSPCITNPVEHEMLRFIKVKSYSEFAPQWSHLIKSFFPNTFSVENIQWIYFKCNIPLDTQLHLGRTFSFQSD